MNAKLRIFVFLADFMLTKIFCGRICDVLFGPSGQSECLFDKQYQLVHQWMTCVNKAFVWRLTNGRESCQRNYCFSECMREFHNITKGMYYILSNNRNLTVVNLSVFLEHQKF